MCGIVGIYGDSNVSKSLYYGLYSIQHRGQESCGISVFDGQKNNVVKGMGLVSDIFSEDSLETLSGKVGVGHVRYSTAGGSSIQNAQPLIGNLRNKNFSIAHNGNLVNYKYLRDMLEEDGYMFSANSDTEVILYLLARYYKGDIVETIKHVMDYIKGAYSLAITIDDTLIVVRDPHGFRPLLFGKKDDTFIFSSEGCAIDILGGEVIRDVYPGEIIIVKDNKMESINYSNYKCVNRSCIFEHIYFARNDATIDNLNAYDFRVKCGETLAKNDDIDFDIVVPVPDSGWAGAIGYSKEKNVEIKEGLVKNRYVGRTFIKPTQEEREIGVRIKLNPLKEVVKDKKIVLIDDSVVRGTTSKLIVKSLKESGAKEVHLRITSPPVKHSCYYGIDTPERENLIASTMDLEKMNEFIESDSIKFLELEDIDNITCDMGGFCKACFDGDYPVKNIDREASLC